MSIPEGQRDLLCFLWIDTTEPRNPNIIKLRFARLAFWLASSPCILNATIKHHLEKYNSKQPKFVANVTNSLYVDDFAFSASSVEDVFTTYKSLKQCFHDGEFNI